MFVDLIHSQMKRKEDIKPEIAVCGGAPTSPHLFKQMLEILKVKSVKVFQPNKQKTQNKTKQNNGFLVGLRFNGNNSGVFPVTAGR